MKATYGEVIKYPKTITQATSITDVKEIPFDVNNKTHKDLILGEYLHTRNSDLFEPREIFKDPITDDGTKKSKKGLLMVVDGLRLENNVEKDSIGVIDQCTWEQESKGLLTTVFKDGKLVKETTLEEIRNRLKTVKNG